MRSNRISKRLAIFVSPPISQIKVNETISFKLAVRMVNILKCKLSVSYNKKFLKMVYPREAMSLSSKLLKRIYKIELKFKALKKTIRPVRIEIHGESDGIYQAAFSEVTIN